MYDILTNKGPVRVTIGSNVFDGFILSFSYDYDLTKDLAEHKSHISHRTVSISIRCLDGSDIDITTSNPIEISEIP